mgnify:CR=1 FL=1
MTISVRLFLSHEFFIAFDPTLLNVVFLSYARFPYLSCIEHVLYENIPKAYFISLTMFSCVIAILTTRK